MIQCSPLQAPRPPTLQECEVIIRQLYSANSLQSQEVRPYFSTSLTIQDWLYMMHFNLSPLRSYVWRLFSKTLFSTRKSLQRITFWPRLFLLMVKGNFFITTFNFRISKSLSYFTPKSKEISFYVYIMEIVHCLENIKNIGPSLY